MAAAVEVAHADSVEDVGFFFKYLGGVRFGEASGPFPGSCATVAAATRFGLVVFSDLQGASAACRRLPPPAHRSGGARGAQAHPRDSGPRVPPRRGHPAGALRPDCRQSPTQFPPPPPIRAAGGAAARSTRRAAAQR
jgi:hypothetical protein